MIGLHSAADTGGTTDLPTAPRNAKEFITESVGAQAKNQSQAPNTTSVLAARVSTLLRECAEARTQADL